MNPNYSENRLPLVHHHFIFHGISSTKKTLTEQILTTFLQDSMNCINMHSLIEARVKLSDQNAWTGVLGIITSHIAFHYFVDDCELQFDVYSCKEFDSEVLRDFLEEWWAITSSHALIIDRKAGHPFEIEKLTSY